MDTVRLYAVLGLKPTASLSDVKKTYKQLALRWHPDRHSNDFKAEAERRFKEIFHAYHTLCAQLESSGDKPFGNRTGGDSHANDVNVNLSFVPRRTYDMYEARPNAQSEMPMPSIERMWWEVYGNISNSFASDEPPPPLPMYDVRPNNTPPVSSLAANNIDRPNSQPQIHSRGTSSSSRGYEHLNPQSYHTHGHDAHSIASPSPACKARPKARSWSTGSQRNREGSEEESLRSIDGARSSHKSRHHRARYSSAPPPTPSESSSSSPSWLRAKGEDSLYPTGPCATSLFFALASASPLIDKPNVQMST